MKWLMSANGTIYDHIGAFDEFGYIDWRQTVKYEVGDTVFIYATKPIMKVMFKTMIEKTNIEFKDVTNDKKYWHDIKEYTKSHNGKYARLRLIERVNNEKLSLHELKKNGLKAAPQSPMRVQGQLEEYLEKYFDDYYSDDVFPEEVNNTVEEGHRRTITVNKYERSSIARGKCIEEHGLNCAVCNMNFEKVYGEIGKGFIHVHHIVPLHEIKGTYKVDYRKDLAPVCPNCHAMLHKKLDEKYVSIEQLKTILKRKKN